MELENIAAAPALAPGWPLPVELTKLVLRLSVESYHDDEKDAAIHLHRAMRVSRVFRTSGSRLMATAVIKTHAVFAFPRLADLKALHVVNISVKQIVRMLDATQGLVAPDRFAKVEKFSMALIDMTNASLGMKDLRKLMGHLPAMQRLVLRGCGPAQKLPRPTAWFAALDEYPRIEELEMHYHASLQVSDIGHFTHLSSLDVECSLDHAMLQRLAEMPRLRHLAAFDVHPTSRIVTVPAWETLTVRDFPKAEEISYMSFLDSGVKLLYNDVFDPNTFVTFKASDALGAVMATLGRCLVDPITLEIVASGRAPVASTPPTLGVAPLLAPLSGPRLVELHLVNWQVTPLVIDEITRTLPGLEYLQFNSCVVDPAAWGLLQTRTATLATSLAL